MVVSFGRVDTRPLPLSPHILRTQNNTTTGHQIYKKEDIYQGTTKVMSAVEEREKCPRIHQIRTLNVHDIAAKGPGWARSLTRKLLGNEEFCFQIDSHCQFVPHWDEKLKQEWAATKNEFGIISTVPRGLEEEDKNDLFTVPRQCWIRFQEIGTPVSRER